MLNVSACEKSSGKKQNIVITNDKGRLSKEQVENMIKEAERLKEEDVQNMKRVEAKNKLESYIYNWRNQLDNKEVSDKLGETDCETIKQCVKETQEWLDANVSATTEEFESKMKECESTLKSIVSKMYSGTQGGMPNAMPKAEENIEEVD